MSDESKDSGQHLEVIAPSAEPTKSVVSLLTRSSKGKVLVVEPDPDLGRMLEVRLGRDGQEVILTTDGKTAVQAASEEAVDVALIDRSLEDMSALELMGKLRESQALFEALLLSVDVTTDVTVRALDAGAFDVMEKPIGDLKIVTHKVRRALSKVNAERERNELARVLHAQTSDIAKREVMAETHGSTDLEEREDESLLDLDNMSGVDPLTGLPNRRAAQDRFRKETARALRYDRPLCIALASVDELERVIQSHGSEVADGVLRGIASMFSGMVRDVDFVARRQGGEFLFIFPETPKEAGYVVVERIRQKLAQTSFTESYGLQDADEFNISASFGVAGLPTDTMNSDILHDAAEEALEHAKAHSDRVVMYEASMSGE